jgi:hypothetical protein
MVRHWLRRLGFAKLDERAIVRGILDASAGSPVRLAQIRPLLADLMSVAPAIRPERLAKWPDLHALSPVQLGLELDSEATFYQVAQIVDGPDQFDPQSDRKTILALVPSAVTEIDRFVRFGLIEELSDGRMRLTRLGRLAVG